MSNLPSKDYKMNLLGIVHCKRDVSVPHWQHQATMSILKMPFTPVDVWEDHNFDIGAARQGATEALLEAFPEITYILYVDDDLATNNRYALMGMYQFLEDRNQSIISALYYNKAPGAYKCPTCGRRKHEPIIFNIVEKDDRLWFSFPFQHETPPLNHAYEVTCVPAGFLLVKREVFEKLEKPWFIYGDPELKKRFGHTEKGPGEDVYFSIKAVKAGYKLWLDTRAEFIHYVPGWSGRQELIDAITRVEKPVTAVRADYFEIMKRKQEEEKKKKLKEE